MRALQNYLKNFLCPRVHCRIRYRSRLAGVSYLVSKSSLRTCMGPGTLPLQIPAHLVIAVKIDSQYLSLIYLD